MKIILLIFGIWFVFLSKITFTLTFNKQVYTASWIGIIWVALDYYTIIRYKSNDKPMKVLTYSKVSDTTDAKWNYKKLKYKNH